MKEEWILCGLAFRGLLVVLLDFLVVFLVFVGGLVCLIFWLFFRVLFEVVLYSFFS